MEVVAHPATIDRHLVILGIRGIPAAHGGFETFAERLALWLTAQGWTVSVYCQEEGEKPITRTTWRGVNLVHIPVKGTGSVSTIKFDIKAAQHALKQPGLILTLGYNTGFLCTLFRLKGRPNVINMDGIEWKRAKYGVLEKAYLWLNERLAVYGASRLIADHPSIKDHLLRLKPTVETTVIPYGADAIAAADKSCLTSIGLQTDDFITVIARPEPENSLLEIVEGFSNKQRGVSLVVLGNYSSDNTYHIRIKAAASKEVIFPGAIYDTRVVKAIRFYSSVYLHGHQVGGTNPSLVEALGAGNAVIAHDNVFNRWVAGDAAVYFDSAESVSTCLDNVLSSSKMLQEMRRNAHVRWAEQFTWDNALIAYRELFLDFMPAAPETSQLNGELG